MTLEKKDFDELYDLSRSIMEQKEKVMKDINHTDANIPGNSCVSPSTSSSTPPSTISTSGFAEILVDNAQNIINALRDEANAKKSGAWLTSTGYINQPGQLKENNLDKGQAIVDAFKNAPKNPINLQALINYHNEISSHKLKNTIGNAVITASVIGTIVGTSGVGLIGLGLVPMGALLAPTISALGTAVGATAIPSFGILPALSVATVVNNFAIGAAIGYAKKGMDSAYNWNEASYNRAVASLEKTIAAQNPPPQATPSVPNLTDDAQKILDHVKLLKLSGHKGIHLSNLSETLRIVDLQLKNSGPNQQEIKWPILDAATTLQKKMQEGGPLGQALASVYGAFTYKNFELAASVALPVGSIATGGVTVFTQRSASLLSNTSSASISHNASLTTQHAKAFLSRAVPFIGASMAQNAATGALNTSGALAVTLSPYNTQPACHVNKLAGQPTENDKKMVQSKSKIVIHKKNDEYSIGFSKGRFFGSYAEQSVKKNSELHNILNQMTVGTHIPNEKDMAIFNQFLKENGAMSRVKPPTIGELVQKHAENLTSETKLDALQTAFDNSKKNAPAVVTPAPSTTIIQYFKNNISNIIPRKLTEEHLLQSDNDSSQSTGRK